MSHVHQAVIDLINRDAEPTEYRLIRELWKVHSIAEDRRDLDGQGELYRNLRCIGGDMESLKLPLSDDRLP